MKRIERITSFVPTPPLSSIQRTGTQLWTASVFTTALLLCVALAFCQEARVAITNQAGEFTTETGVKGTVTMDGEPVAGAVVTFTPSPYATPQGGYTHKVVFGPKGDFQPSNPMQLLNELNEPLFKTNISTGYFRTWPENDRLIGGILTHDAEGLRNVIESAPRLEFIKVERLTAESFAAYERTSQLSLPPADGGYATPQGGFTHLIVFGAKGEFVPVNPMDYMSLVNPRLAEFGVHAGYFRSRPEDGKLIAFNLTTTPEAYKRLIDSIPQLEYIRTVRLTREMFEAYEQTHQESLLPADGGYKTPEGGYTHKIVFGAKDGFVPANMGDYTNLVHPKLREFGVHTGYFRSKLEDDKLIAYYLTSTPEAYKKLIDSLPQLEYLRTERLTKKMFEVYIKTLRFDSLPPERIRSYMVGKSVWDYPSNVISLSIPEDAYAYGNRILYRSYHFPSETIENLRLYSTMNMIVPAEMEQWINTTTPLDRIRLRDAQILQVFLYKDKYAMVVAEVVKGEKYNYRLFENVKEHWYFGGDHWFITGDSGLFDGKSVEDTIKMVADTFGKLADDWDKEKEEVWQTPDDVGHTHLATFEPQGGFNPANAQALLDHLNSALVHNSNVPTGYFRTGIVDGKMVGRICTNNPTGLRKMFWGPLSNLRLLKLEPLSEKLFEQHLRESREPATVSTESGDAVPKLTSAFKLEVLGPDEIRRDESVTYTFVVHNIGIESFENLRFELAHRPGERSSTCTMDKPLLPGEKQEVSIVVQAGRDQEQVDIAVVVTGDNGVRAEVRRSIWVVRSDTEPFKTPEAQ